MSVSFKIGKAADVCALFLDGYIVVLHSSMVVYGSFRDLQYQYVRIVEYSYFNTV